MTREEHQKILFGDLFNGLDQPLIFKVVTPERREAFKRMMEKPRAKVV
jgi:hypothetical protein